MHYHTFDEEQGNIHDNDNMRPFLMCSNQNEHEKNDIKSDENSLFN